jgi:heat shock protein HtpX
VLLPGWGNPEPSWLRTHPATAERVRRLLELAPATRAPRSGWAGGGVFPDFGNAPITQPPRWRFGGLWR